MVEQLLRVGPPARHAPAPPAQPLRPAAISRIPHVLCSARTVM